MKGFVRSMVSVAGQNGTYYRVQIESNGQTIEYLAKDSRTVSALTNAKNGNTEIEFATTPPRDGKGSSWVRINDGSGSGGGGGRGGYQQSKDESFALSYSKDIVVAMITAGLIKKTEKVPILHVIDTVTDHFYKKFISMLKATTGTGPGVPAAPPVQQPAPPPPPPQPPEDDIPF